MSAGQDKTLKIQASVDTASFAKATNALRELSREVERLVTATSKLNFGGGGMGMRISSTTPQSGGPSSIAQMTSKFGTGTGGGQGGVANSLAQAVVQSTALFKTAAAGSKDAFRGMQDNLRALVQTSTREIATLTTSLTRLETVFNRFRSGGGGRALPAMGGGGGGRVIDVEGRSVPAGGGQRMLGPMGGGGGFGGGGSYTGPLYGGGGAGASASAGLFPGGIGAKALGGGIAAGLALANFGISASYENKAANLQYGIGLAGQTLNRSATYGDIYGGNATRLSHGDIALSHAMRMAAKDKDYQQATADSIGQQRLELARLVNPTDLTGHTYKGGLPDVTNLLRGGPIGGGAQTYLKAKGGQLINSGLAGDERGARMRARMAATPMSFAGASGRGTVSGRGDAPMGATSLSGAVTGTPGQLSTDQIKQNEAKNLLPELVAQQRQDALMAVMRRNPLLNSQMQEYSSGALGDLNLARMARVGGGLVKDPSTGLYTGDAVANFKERSIAAGWDPGQVAGMQQQIGHQVGWAARGVGAQSMLSKQMGGFTSAVNIAAMGNQFGGGGGRLVNAIAGRGGMVGRGGLDVSAGAGIFGAGAGMMASGNFAGSGLGLMQTLGAAGFTGTSGGDMRQARAMEAGIGAMGSVLSGNIDPLQRGLNASAAMRAAPNAPYATHAALMSMDPGTLLAAVKSGKVPPELLDQGVTLPILQKYMATQNGTAFARYSESMGAGTPVGAAIARYQKSGGNMAYMKGWKLSEKQEELRRLGLGAKLAGGATSLEAGESRMRIQAAAEGVLKSPKGAGAFAVGASGPRKAILKSTGRLAGMAGEGIAAAENEGGLVSGAAADMPKNMIESEKQRQATQAGAADTKGGAGVEGALTSLDAAFRSFIQALRGDPQIASAKMGGIKKATAPGGR